MEAQEVKTKISKGKKIKFIISTLIFLLVIVSIISEILLYAFHYESTYDKVKDFSLVQAKWWACDSISGPRYVANKMDDIDSSTYKDEMWYFKRLKMVNNAGYHDKDDFVEIPASSDSLRVLVNGDSFTWGASADIGSSYVDVFESDIKKVYPSVVWNTGIPATGTNHAIFTTKKFMPLQKSNYVVLGFFVGNDFIDNLLPFDRLVFNGGNGCYNLYDYDEDFKPYKISQDEMCKKVTGSYPLGKLNFFQKLIARSRVGTYLGEIKTRLVNWVSGNRKRTADEEYKKTEAYIKELNAYVKENNAELIVLVIPTEADIKEKGTAYQNIVKILNGASVKYIDNTALFTESDYMKTGGGHWKNSGHLKAGHALSKYLLDYIQQHGQKSFRKN